METIFQICWSNTIGALLIAVAALLAAALCRRPAVVHFLWVLVLIKLPLPPIVDVPLSIATRGADREQAKTSSAIPRSKVPADEPRATIAGKDIASANPSAQGNGPSRGSAAAPPAIPAIRRGDLLRKVTSHTPLSIYPLALAASLGVSACWYCWAIRRAGQFHRLLRWASLAPADAQDLVVELASGFGLRRAPLLWFVPAPISPMLWTLGARPRLLFPEALWARLDPEKRATLLAHELAHLKRCDHWVRLLEIAAAGLYWWNPLVWWARRALRNAEERCCDDWVVRAFPERAQAYASAILETLDCLAGAPPPEPMGATGLFSASQLKRRLMEILSSSPSREIPRVGAIGLCGLAIAALAMGPAFSPSRSYKPMDIGTLGGNAVTGFRLNNRGQVAGWSTLADRRDPTGRTIVRHPFRTAPNQPIDPAADDLANLIGASEPAEIVQYGAYDINNRGQVIVWLHGNWISSGGDRTFDRGFWIDGDRALELAAGLAPTPRAVNDSGQIAGHIRQVRRGPRLVGREPFLVRNEDTDWIAFRATAGQPVVAARDGLGNPWGRSPEGLYYATASDLNALGQVVGEAVGADGAAHAFRTAPGQPIDAASDDLGTLANGRSGSTDRGMSRARAINDLGQAAGAASGGIGSGHHAFRTAPNRPIDPATDDLGTLGGPSSEAWGINNRGDVVGEADIAPGSSQAPAHAFLSTSGKMIDLNSCVEIETGWVLVRAFDINDRGQIVAAATLDSRDWSPEVQRTYLLTPAPGPAPLALLLVGSTLTGAQAAARRWKLWILGRSRAESKRILFSG